MEGQSKLVSGQLPFSYTPSRYGATLAFSYGRLANVSLIFALIFHSVSSLTPLILLYSVYQ